jgi:hypothetical protein
LRHAADDGSLSMTLLASPRKHSMPHLARALALAVFVLSAPIAFSAPNELDATQPVRVSDDILAPSSEAQPETQAESSVAINPENPANILAGYQEHRFADGGARALTFAVSFDDGATWREGLVPKLTIASGGVWDRASDPWVAFGPGNRAYFASLVFNRRNAENGVAVSSSLDGGATWGDPVVVARSTARAHDKEAVTVDMSPESPYFGSVYLSWDIVYPKQGTLEQRVVVARSRDGGATWSKLARVKEKGSNIGALPRVGRDGSVYLIWAGASKSGTKVWVYFSRSGDGGVTWSEPRRVARMFPRGVPELRAGASLPSFDVDDETDELFVAWDDARFTGDDEPAFVRSDDGGETWSDVVRVPAPGGAPVFTVSVAALDGRAALGFYSLANDPDERYLADYYVAVEREDGSFATVRVTRESFDVRFAARASGAYFLGDYTGLDAVDGRIGALFVAPYETSRLDAARREPDAYFAAVGVSPSRP